MSAPLPGYVYFDPTFKYLDETYGKKLFVVLCDSTLSDENVLVARTTSKQKSDITLGCYTGTHPPCFCLPDSDNNFTKDTWIMLDYVLEYERVKLESINRTTDLSFEHTKALLGCSTTSMYLAKWQVSAIQSELDNLS